MTTLDPDVRAYYEQGLERDRLVPSRPGGWWERLRTADVLARALPAPPAAVLDVGGAAGVYAVPLTSDGYAVTLVDPVPLHVLLGDLADRLADPDRRAVLLTAARRVEEVAELQGASSHLLAVGRAPAG